jgi:hypothetical protein
MAANEIILELQEGGVLRFPGPMLKKYDLKKGSRVKLIPKTERFFWLETESPGGRGGIKGDVSFFGDIAMFGIADLLSLINMGQKTGALVIESKGSRKTAFFKAGDVVFAASNDPEDKLGHVLYKTGKITKEKLAEAETKITPETRFGTVLIQHNYVAPKDLWWAIKYQVEEIVYSIFSIKEGVFYFIDNETVDEDLMRFSLNTQNILMEGFRRLDEMGLIREKIPNHDVVLRTIPQVLATRKVSPAVEKVLQYIDGKNNVRDIIRLSGVGEFNIFKLFYELLKMGVVEVQGAQQSAEAAGPSGDPMEKLIDDYNRIYGFVYAFLKSRNLNIDIREAFNAFFGSVSPNLRQLFNKVSLTDDGLLNKSLLLKNFREANVLKGGMFSKIAGLGDLMSGQILSEGLNELLNFELFTAKNTLSQEDADKLILKVREAQAKIQNSTEPK